MNSSPDVLVWGCVAAAAACAGVLCLRWGSRRWEYRDRARLVAEPRCLRCGYIVRRGSPVVCPECGSDVRERGVVTPGLLPPLPAWPWYGMAALGALSVGVALGWLVEERQPFGWNYIIDRWVVTDPANPDRAQVTVQAIGKGRYFEKRPEYVDVFSGSISGPGPAVGLTISRPAMTVRRWDRNGAETPFDRAALEAFVREVVPDSPAGNRERVASQLEADVAALLAGDFSSWERPDRDWGRRGSLNYFLRKPARFAVRAACCVPAVAVAAWFTLRALARRREHVRAQWRRAADALGLKEIVR